MAIERKSLHVVDADHVTVAGRITRSIRNWQCYRSAAGVLLPTDQAAEVQPGAPADWAGAWDFTLASLRAPLQIFFRDSSDAANRAMWGVRRSDVPGAWVNWKALGVDNGAQEPAVASGGRSVTWTDLWANVDLRLDVLPHACAKSLILKSPGHAASFRFALRLPNSYSFTQTGDVLSILDGNGVEQLRTKPLSGWDANERRVRVALVQAASVTVGGNTLPTFRVVPNAADLAAATYPVTIDPTTTVSGTTDITDANLRSGSPTNNYGGNVASLGIYSATSTRRNVVLKAATSAIPDSSNTIDAVRVIVKENLAAGATCTAYLIQPANTWVEGNSNGSNESGACDWSYAKDASQAWAGSAGCMTSGTDYDASGVSVVITSLGTITTTLTTSWGTTWQTSANNNGILIINPSAGASLLGIVCSEGGAGAPYFEFDYTAGGATGQPTACRSRYVPHVRRGGFLR